MAAYRAGEPEYTGRPATLIVKCADLTAPAPRLTGTGTDGEAGLCLSATATFRAHAARLPLRLDLFFIAGDRIAVSPRAPRLEDG